MSESFINISIGASHTWTIVRTINNGHVDKTTLNADDVEVLAGLQFGWTMDGPLWPVQPDPMTAALAINAPAFADVADINEGDPIAISVYIDGPGEFATFHGRITDLKATPRGRRRPGVLLSVVAVDYTVDVGEAQPIQFVPDGTDYVRKDWDLVDTGFVAACGGSLPGTVPGVTPPTMWTSPTAINHNVDGDFQNPRDVVDQMLLEAIDPTDDTRMILSPIITYLGELPSTGRRFTLDTFSNTDLDLVATIPAAQIHRDQIEWAQVKGEQPTQIHVDGRYTDLSYTATVTGLGPPDSTITINSKCLTDDHAQDVAEFYAAAPIGTGTWQIDRITWDLTSIDEQPPFTEGDIFPRWADAEGSATRTDCYHATVEIEDLDATVLPFEPAGIVTGLLRGATLTINRDRMLLDLTLKPVTY